MKSIYFWLLLLIKSLACLLFVYYRVIPLNPDEAQYWLWSRYLDIGYYSKPLGIAYQIAVGCYLWGQNEFGVRFFSIIFSGAIAYVVRMLSFQISQDIFKANAAGIAFICTPMSLLGSMVAATDLGMIFFLLLAFYFAHRALEGISTHLPVSCCLALGACFKWTLYLFWPVYILLAYRKKKASALSYYFLLSLTGLLPSLVWNYYHSFSTFKHVYTQSTGGHRAYDGNLLTFLFSQALLLGPFLFFYLLNDIVALRRELGKHLLPTFVGLIFIVYSLMSVFTKIQPNWMVFIYPLYLAYFLNKRSSPSLFLANISSVLLTCLALSIPMLQATTGWPSSYSLNPFRHHMGWQALPSLLEKLGYRPSKDFLCSHKYQTSATLSFYSLQKQRAYLLRMGNSRKNQFDFWPQLPEKEVGQDGFFIFIENEPHYSKGLEHRKLDLENNLSPYFSSVELIHEGALYKIGDKLAKGILVYKGLQYNGKVPEGKKFLW